MDIKDFFNNWTPEQIEEKNKRQLEINKKVHKEFKSAYDKGYCSLCGKPLTLFDESKPCYHWFLMPNGIRKRHFEKYLAKPIGFFRFDSYIKWIANLEAPMKNINDLKDAMNPAKIIEYTVKYKNIEWSINVGKNDLTGHIDSQNANFPHFHLQMIVDNEIFLRFNDFHIPLSDEDIFTFRAIQEVPDKVMWRNTYGQGMSVLEDEELLEQVDKHMQRVEDISKGTFNTDTFVQMPEGETISEELIEKVLKEAHETGIPARHLFEKYLPNAKIFTQISAGEGVPKIKTRNKRNKKK